MRNIYGILDNQGGSFKQYFLENNMPEKIRNLKDGLDEASCEILDRCLYRMLHLPDFTKSFLWYVDFDVYRQHFESPEEKFYRELYEVKVETYKKSFNLDGDSYNPDTFLFHHGLFFCNDNIKEYIKEKVFIDGGAYIGDSVLILNTYAPSKIVSFELSKKNAEKYLHIMQLNSISKEKYLLINKGLSDKESSMSFNDTGDQGASLCYTGNNSINLISIDNFCKNSNEQIGFIKADVEGYGLKALQGMLETIRRHRPVLSLAIYHTPEEFFEMKPYLQEITKDLNYKINIFHLHCFCDFLVDVVLFAYPAELHTSDNCLENVIGKIGQHPLARFLRHFLR